MLYTCVKMEIKKLRHSHLWLVFLIIPILPAFMGGGNYVQNIGVLKREWYSLWTQCSLFYANFFYAPLIALYCAYSWRLEHMNHNWNQIMTLPLPVRSLFLSKLTLALGCTFFLQFWMWTLFIVTGRIVGLHGFPPVTIFLWLLRGSLGALGIAALQLLLSMTIRSFAVTIAIALMGSVIGMMASNGGYGLFWPYCLMLMGMNANHDYDMVSNVIGFCLSAAVFLILFTASGILWLKKKDVAAG